MDQTPAAPALQPQPSAPQPVAAGAPRSLGELLTDSLTLTTDSVWVCVGIIAAGLVPGILLELFLLPPGTTKETLKAAVAAGNFAPVAISAGIKLVDRLIRSFCGVAVIAALDARARGSEGSIGESLGAASALYGAYLLAVVFSSLWVIGGLLLLIIPGIYFALRYVFVPMAVVVDGRRGGGALARSAEIFKVYPGKIVGNLFVAGICVLLVGGLSAFVVSLALGMSSAPGAVTAFAAELVASAVGIWGTAFALLLFKDLAALVPAA